MAALTAAREARLLPAPDILGRLTRALHDRTAPLDLAIPPSTTVAAVLDCGKSWRFLLLGDTAIRINGAEILCHNKLIDDVSTAARVRIFGLLRPRFQDDDTLEYAARRVIMLGLDTAISDGTLSDMTVRQLLEEVVATTALEDHAATVDRFLRGGIKTQFTFANGTGPLAFDTMNGTDIRLVDIIDETRPKAEVSSVEIFTDGYPVVPTEVSPDAWEESHARAEQEDYHKIGAYPSVKGSTGTEFFDDRTVLLLRDMIGQGAVESPT